MAHDMTLGGDGVMAAAAPPRTRAAARRRPLRSPLPFYGIMLFTFVLFAAPQNLVPPLQELMLAKLTVGVAMAAYLVNRFGTGRLTVFTPPVRWALVFGAVGVLSIPLGFWPGGSVNVFLDQLGKSLVVFVLLANVIDTPRRAKVLIGSMIAWGALVGAYVVWQFGAGMMGPHGERIAGYASPVAANPNDLALTLNLLLGLALGLLPVLRRRRPRLLVLAAIALLVAGIIVTFSRGGFLTLAVLGIVWTVRALRTQGILALVPVVAATVLMLIVAPPGYLTRLSTILDTETDPTGSAQERWVMMVAALTQFSERPLLGYGLGNSLHVNVARGLPANEPHNVYLKVGAEMGLGGVLSYTVLLGSVFAAARGVRRRLARDRQQRELAHLARGVELALLAFVIGALFSPVPYHFYFFYPAGLAVALAAMAGRPAPAPVRAAQA
jgi:O-antigen ligase